MKNRSMVEAHTAEWLLKHLPRAKGARIEVGDEGLVLSWAGVEVREAWSDPLDYPECLRQAAEAVARLRNGVAAAS